MILDLFEQIPFVQDLPAAAQGIVARALLIVSVFTLIVVLRRVLMLFLVRPLRRLAKRTGFEEDDAILDRVITPMRLLVIALAIFISNEVFKIDDALYDFIANLGRTFVILSILSLLYQFIDIVAPSSRTLSKITGLELDERLLPFLRTAAKIVIMALGIVIVLQEWNYDVSGLIAGLGLGGLAFSLAAQDTAANLFGFMAIVADNPFEVGEFVVTPDATGIVEHVGLRTTLIRQLDQAAVYVPNSSLANGTITNWSRLEKRRLDYVLGVTYDTTSGDMRVLLHRVREMLSAQESVDSESITVYFVGFGDSALEIMVRCYVNIADWGEFQAEKERLHMEVMDIVDELGLTIAFPSMSLYVENLPPISTPQERPEPRLSHEERALQEGYRQSDQESPKTTDDPSQNVTGQQDDADADE